MATSTHPDDSGLLRDRDTRRAQAVHADQQAAAAEADDDLERAAALRHEAAEHIRAAESTERQLRTNQDAGVRPWPTPLWPIMELRRSTTPPPVENAGTSMIEEHLDPTAEAHAHMSNLLRTLVTSAAGVADKRAQRRAHEQQDMQRRSEAEQRALNERVTAERQAAELVYRRTSRDSWWEKARPEEISEAVAAAGAWAGSDPRANDALSHIGEQLEARYGLDLTELYRSGQDPNTIPGQVRDQVVTSEAARATAAAEAAAARPVDAGPPWEAEVLDAAGPTLGRQILDSEGWPHLQQRLTALDAAGEDVPGRLTRAVNERELDSAKDKSLALTWRLKKPAADTSAGKHGADASRRATTGASPPWAAVHAGLGGSPAAGEVR